MDNNVLRKLFTYSGTFPLHYDLNTGFYNVSKGITIYTFFFIVLTNCINAYGIFANLFGVSSSLFKGLRDESTGRNIVFIDFLGYLIIVCSTPILLFLKREKFCSCINDLRKFKQQQQCIFQVEIRTFQKRLEWIVHSLIVVSVVAIPPSFSLYEDLPAYVRYLYAYFFSIHLVLGQLLEFLLFKWFCFYFRIINGELTLKDDADIKVWIDKFDNLVGICRKSCRIFGILKVIHLTSANVLMSIYAFYNYDNVRGWFNMILWQLMIVSVYYLCYLWDKLTDQVSAQLLSKLINNQKSGTMWLSSEVMSSVDYN